MAKVDKLALVRLALRETLANLDPCEKLCVLADMYAGKAVEGEPPLVRQRRRHCRAGAGHLQQHDHVPQGFQPVAKMLVLTPDSKQETYLLRDFLIEKLDGRLVSQFTEAQEAPSE